MNKRALSLVLAAAVVVLAPAPASAAKPKVNVQIFRPVGHPGDYLSTRSASIPRHMTWSAGVLVNYGRYPLVFEDPWRTDDPRGNRDEVISDQITLDLMGSIALFEWVDVSLALPLFPLNSGQSAEGYTGYGPVDGFALGDIRLSPKVRILKRAANDSGFGLAAEVLFGLPTGDSEAFTTDGFTVEPTVLADFRFPGVPVTVAANLGFLYREEQRLLYEGIDVGPGLQWRFGADYEALPGELSVLGELHGNISSFDSEPGTKNVEWLLGGRYVIAKLGLAFTLGGGGAFTSGYGSAAYRVLGGISYIMGGSFDADGDGLVGDDDQCPSEAEDADGFEDTDGCPDPDNDKDGIDDAEDDCPEAPEDADGFQDTDGCPDPDNDNDGVLDADDKCPGVAEDMDGFQDADGCPEPDNDNDGIEDSKDKCPNQPENMNDHEDDDGCPDEKLAKVEKGKIVILDKVYFVTGSDRIRRRSFPVLEAVSNILKLYGNIKKVRVEGHTDQRGSARSNLKLSQKRADSVRKWLIEHGIDGERLIAVGYGEEIPAVEGQSRAAMAANRRVEFVILESD